MVGPPIRVPRHWRRAGAVLLVAAAAEAAFLYPLKFLPVEQVFGIPGALAALIAVSAAVLAGPWVGVAVAGVGGVSFYVFVAQGGQRSLPETVVMSTCLWATAAVVAGLGAERVRKRSERRETALSHALDDSLRARIAIDEILDLAPAFQTTAPEGIPETVCQGALATFDCTAAYLFHAAPGALTLLGRAPSRPGLEPGTTFDLDGMADLQAALRSRTPKFIRDARNDPIASWLHDGPTKSLLKAPLRVTHGSRSAEYMLILAWSETREPIDTAMFAMVQRFGDQAVLALEHAELGRLHSRLAAGLLPSRGSPHPTLRIGSRYRPGEARLGLGGDFYDLVPAQQTGLRFIIGDVSGHGPDAAALAATLRSTWRAMALNDATISATMKALQQVIVLDRTDPNLFCTCLTGWIDPDNAGLTIVNVAHPPAFLLSDSVAILDVPPTPPLGFNDLSRWPRTKVTLPERWTLFCYTDGLVEGRAAPDARERFGIDRLGERLERECETTPGEAEIDALIAELEAANGGPFADDVAVLTISYDPTADSADSPPSTERARAVSSRSR